MSTPAEADHRSAAACTAWLAVSDGLLAGIHHALNNRMASVSALSQLLALDGTPGANVEHALLDELERFGAALRLLRLLPRHPGEEEIPLRVSELLPDALALVGMHREVRETDFVVEADSGVLPVLCAESALVHALLALLMSTGEAAGERGGRRVTVRCRGDDRRVVLEAEVEGGTGGELPHAAGVAALFREVGGEVRTTSTGYEVRLPTLLEARRPEGQAGAPGGECTRSPGL
ncbi:MAG TPA: hypothetical protein VHG28_01435 [Longimicrobiaceae bacterium]|nr:hypothetical protein [Longimicrobiaceae bacterium]